MSLDLLAAGRASMEMEAEAIACAARRLDASFASAVRLIAGHAGKVIVTGLGKSGFVAQKLAATLCSTGTPAAFLHPVDAMHGDVGIYAEGDPTILLSKSGTTLELLRLIPVLRGLNSPLIGIIGNRASPLAKQIDVLLDASVRAEADPHNLAPTASTAVATAIGDALALAVMQTRELTPEDFAQRHPAGQLGRNLRVTVRQVMHSGDEVAWAKRESSIKQVIIAMNRCPLGAACVVGEDRPSGRRDHRRRSAARFAIERRYPRSQGWRSDDGASGDREPRCHVDGSAAADGRPAFADFRAAGDGRRALPRARAPARSLSDGAAMNWENGCGLRLVAGRDFESRREGSAGTSDGR